MSAEPVGRRTHPCSVPSPADGYGRWKKFRDLKIREGTWEPFIDAAPVVAHVATLRASGMSVRLIASLAGVPLSTLAPLAWPEHGDARSQVRPGLADALLGVRFDLDRVPAERLVSGLGTGRRLRALVALGWPLRVLAQRMGVSEQRVHQLMRSVSVTAGKAREVRALYLQLHMTPGPSRVSGERAAAKRWAPPAAWDDIDDPRERPKGLGAAPKPVRSSREDSAVT